MKVTVVGGTLAVDDVLLVFSSAKAEWKIVEEELELDPDEVGTVEIESVDGGVVVDCKCIAALLADKSLVVLELSV